ncbi:MAG: hypothetical protein NDI82_06140 [Anaeromyxobacteraceae bacterium]|nr:hypothetical protein [Anaeromyxobacteraceae bacterium]
MRSPLLQALSLPALLAALLVPTAAPAVEVNDGQLSIHGDGQWSYQRTSGDNAYGSARPGGNYDTAMFDLVLTARAADDLVISTQLGFEPEGTELEWAFAEWRHSDRLRLRVGKVQQPFGNLNELRFAGTTRAHFDLPAGIYGPGNVTGHAYLGVGLTGQLWSRDDWSLAYDLYGGAVELEELENYRGLEPGGAPDEPVEPDEQQARDLLGGRLSLAGPGDVTLRASAYGGRLQKDEHDSDGFWVAALSFERRGERLWLAAEAALSVEVGAEIARTAYASAAWFFTDELQAALRYEHQRTRLDELAPGYTRQHPLLRHEQFTAGLNWWFNPGLVFKASWALVEGNRFSFPAEASGEPVTVGALPTLDLEQRTQVVIVGTQFAF